METSTAMFDKEKAQERLSKLSGGVAVFKVWSLLQEIFFRLVSLFLTVILYLFFRLEGLVR